MKRTEIAGPQGDRAVGLWTGRRRSCLEVQMWGKRGERAEGHQLFLHRQEISVGLSRNRETREILGGERLPRKWIRGLCG